MPLLMLSTRHRLELLPQLKLNQKLHPRELQLQLRNPLLLPLRAKLMQTKTRRKMLSLTSELLYLEVLL